MLKNYKHVIWDWNGTLFNDVELSIELVNQLLGARGLPVLDAGSYRSVFTIPVRDYYVRLGFDFERESFEVVGQLWMDEYERRKLGCGLYEGLPGVLEQVQRLGLGQSILSAYSQHTLREIVSHYGLSHYFSHIVGLDNIYAASKLHLGKALIETLGLSKGQCVVIGDTAHDFEVACAMQADCILIANGHQSKERLQALGAPVLDELSQLLG